MFKVILGLNKLGRGKAVEFIFDCHSHLTDLNLEKAVDEIGQNLADNESVDYELCGHHTKSGNPELISFDESEIEFIIVDN